MRRGGEEAEALGEAGIPFEVVPAVTSVLAVPAYAGIPVIHRGEAVRVCLVTAHEDPTKPSAQVDWRCFGHDPSMTLAAYMPVANLAAIGRPYGFTVCCFPVKIKAASAGWARPIAIIEE